MNNELMGKIYENMILAQIKICIQNVNLVLNEQVSFVELSSVLEVHCITEHILSTTTLQNKKKLV